MSFRYIPGLAVCHLHRTQQTIRLACKSGLLDLGASEVGGEAHVCTALATWWRLKGESGKMWCAGGATKTCGLYHPTSPQRQKDEV